MDKGKKGAVLTLALLVMFVGTIILGGLFMYLDTSMLLATKGEENAVNYYAADSGIEDAILWLQHEPWGTPNESLAGWEPCNPRNPPDQPCLNSYNIGNRTVDVSVVNPQSEGFGVSATILSRLTPQPPLIVVLELKLHPTSKWHN